ncbi:MAG: ATPase, T2SS/T4P/T4SS family, partial [Myxococcota bacterium]
EAGAEAEDDDGIAFEEFEIDLDGDDDFEPLDPADDPPTRQAPVPQPIAEPEPSAPQPAAVAAPTEDAPPLTTDAIDTMLGDVTVDGIQINSTHSVAVRRGHAATVIPGSFESQEVLDTLAEALAKRAGFDELSDHIMDGTLPGGMALHIIPKSLAPEGPIVTLSRATAKTTSASDLVDNGTLTEPIKEALESAIMARKNVVIVSARHSGRSTMLSALSHFIPADERVALVEETREVSVPQRNTMRLDKGALRKSGEGFLDIVPQLDADRVLIDPMSAEDIVEFVGLALGGHDGMMVTFQGRSATAVLRRMSLAVELAVGAALGERARDMVAEAVDLIVVIDHAEDGIVVREVITVDDSGPSGFRTSEILAYS